MRFYTNSHPYYCGIDLHARMLYVCILDDQGKTVAHKKIKAEPEALLNLVRPYIGNIVIGVECMHCWYWVADWCNEQGVDFVLGHALYMKAIHGRYLYRGVISDRQIIAHADGRVTFTYKNSETREAEYRTLKGEDFLWLVLQHVLPKRFRRARDYGFLHCRAKSWLSLVQLILQVILEPLEPAIRPKYPCRFCGCDMKAIAFRFTGST